MNQTIEINRDQARVLVPILEQTNNDIVNMIEFIQEQMEEDENEIKGIED